MIRRKITLPILIVLAVAAIGVAIAGTIVAQTGGNLADDLQPKEGDAEAVATVQDQDVTRGDVRRMVEFQRMTDGSMTKDAAVGKSIVIVIDGFITEAEVNRRELTPTSEEARDYMNRQRDFCLGEGGQNAALTSKGWGSIPIAMNTGRTSVSSNMGRQWAKSNSSGLLSLSETWRTLATKTISPCGMPCPASFAVKQRSSGMTRTWRRRIRGRSRRSKREQTTRTS